MSKVDEKSDRSGSYVSSLFSSDVDNEIKRLQAQVDLFWEEERLLYDCYGMADMSSVLDCGSGPGHLVKRLALQYPNVKFFSLEMDSTYCAYQNTTFHDENIDNISVCHGTIEQNEFPPGSFDAIVIRLVLEHVPNVKASFIALKKLLKPAGRLFVIDNDFSLHLKTTPDVESLDLLYKAYCNARLAEGGDPYIGRKLPTLFKNYGFSDIELQTVTVHSEFSGDRAFLKSESSAVGMVLVKNGFLEPEVFDKLAVEWRNLLAIEDHSFMRLLFFCTGILKDEDLLEKITTTTEEHIAEPNSASATDTTPESINNFLKHEIERLIKQDLTAVENLNSQTLIHLGIDSISAIDLTETIEKTFAVSVSTVYLLGETNIGMLVDLIQKSENGLHINFQDSVHEEGEI